MCIRLISTLLGAGMQVQVEGGGGSRSACESVTQTMHVHTRIYDTGAWYKVSE
jgi:hypothetical protein